MVMIEGFTMTGIEGRSGPAHENGVGDELLQPGRRLEHLREKVADTHRRTVSEAIRAQALVLRPVNSSIVW